MAAVVKTLQMTADAEVSPVEVRPAQAMAVPAMWVLNGRNGEWIR